MRRALLWLGISLSVATPAAAQRSLAIKRFDADIQVNRDGTVEVNETITAQFTGSWNGIYRTIPVEYRTPQGLNWTLRLDLLGATGDGPETGPLRVESQREGHYIKYKIWVPGAQDVTRTVTLHYRARNGLRFFTDHDELYWNVTGDEWDVPIEAATAVIRLPDGATGVRAIAFNGVYGATARDAQVAIEGTTIRLGMPQGLGFREGLTAVVGWDKGLVPEPTRAEKAVEVAENNWPLGMPVVVLVGMTLLWYRVGRDPGRRPVVVQYEPPGSLTPAEAGALVDESADMRDITATLIDLAVHGRLRIEEREESRFFGLMKKQEFVFRRLAPEAGARPMEPHERLVLNGLFDGREEVELSQLEDDFYRHLPGIRSAIFDRLVNRGLYRSRPDKVKGYWVAGGIALAVALVGLGTMLAARMNLTPGPVFIAAIVSGLVLVAFSRVMPARTVQGARTVEQVLGFEEFLRRVEGERFERIVRTPELFERFLPYAMAFKVERRWARAFEDIYREPPRWYVGTGAAGFDFGRFSSRLDELNTRAASTLSSSPRSSGGSGFSGGSSGGGSGGGGGGGF